MPVEYRVTQGRSSGLALPEGRIELSTTEQWDVRTLLDQARQDQRAEDAWIAEHAGALSASQIGGCLRREKLRLMGTAETNPPTAATLRRWRWGIAFEQEVYDQALSQNRRPKRQVPCELDVDGILLVGHADLVFTEGIVEVKTTGAWEMHEDYLPFPHLMQLGTYMTALDRPGQLLYGSFMREWAFDFQTVPEIWEPWVREVARLFAEHPDADPLPYPPQRLYCPSCPYLESCPTDEPSPTEKPLTSLETQIIERYLAVHQESTAAGKRDDEAKADLLGVREVRGMDEKGVCKLQLPGRLVVIKQGTQERVDYTALDPAIKEKLPRKTIVVTTIKTTEE